MTTVMPDGVASDGLRARLGVRQGAFDLDVDLRLEPGSVLGLVGPNGAGKSTTLRALAGLLPLDSGRLSLDGEILDDPVAGTFVPAQARRVGMVFQDYLLFGHLSVLENVAFGLRSRGTDRRQARAEAFTWLERMELEEFAHRRPSGLSGGQAQRVALARALATGPRLLLLDEPLAALDAGTRTVIRSELRRHLARFDGCTVLVTHDPLDAMVLADELAVLEDGRLVQRAAPADVARAPRTDYVARLVGLNLLRGRAERVHAGVTVTLVDGVVVTATDVDPTVGGDGFAAFAPSAVALYRQRPDGSPRNAWSGTVAGIEEHGATVRVLLRLDGRTRGLDDGTCGLADGTGGLADGTRGLDDATYVLADVTPAAVAQLDLVPGAGVWATVKATEVHVYPV